MGGWAGRMELQSRDVDVEECMHDTDNLKY